MAIPKPIHALSGHCSIVRDGTLYVYSPEGFQSLPLKEGGRWQEEAMGQSVTGGQCVQDASSLYVVGGTVNATSSTWGYPGLQAYNFANKKWDWIRPVDWVTQNRLNHAVAYLKTSNSLLVYSGSQTAGDFGPSSSTFLISLTAPYAVQGFSSTAPPAVKPMLLPFDDSRAAMLGGGASNEAVFTFSREQGWQNLGVTLTEPFTNPNQVQVTVVTGDDGSKILERFDMSTSPNKVNRYVLTDASGKPAAPGTTVGDSKSKRDLTIQNWPTYNGTLAPTATRTGYSIAQQNNGQVVITGGNEQDPLCIFDQKSNSWVNATELFSGAQANILSTPSATLIPSATSPASSSIPSATDTAATAAAPASTKNRMLTVLGATLGAIFGIAAILILLLICIKYKREKRKKQQAAAYIEKDRLSFADRGAEFMSEAGGAVGPKYNASMNASQSSLAIMSNQAGHKRGLGPLGSDASTTGLVKKTSPLGYSEPLEMSKFDIKPEPLTEEKYEYQKPSDTAPRAANNIGRSRSSGWSRYFANNEATNLAAMPSGRSTYASERTSTGSQSMYTESRMYSQPSQTVPPLDLSFNKFDGQRISRVATGSPTLGHSQENLPHQHQPMQAEIARANSNGSSRSGISDSHYERHPTENWTPVGGGNTWNERPPSSNYTNSVVVPDGKDTNSYFPNDGTSSFYPKSNYSSFYPGQRQAEERESTVTVFPRGIPEDAGPTRRNPGQQDMSWLNLGAGTR